MKKKIYLMATLEVDCEEDSTLENIIDSDYDNIGRPLRILEDHGWIVTEKTLASMPEESLSPDDIVLICTCYGCPHSFDMITHGGKLIGGIRFRWGHLQCWPYGEDGSYLDNCWDWYDSDDMKGIIDDDSLLDTCKEKLVSWYNEQGIHDFSCYVDSADYTL